MKEQRFKDGEVVEWRALDAQGDPVGDWVEFSRTNGSWQPGRPPAESTGSVPCGEEIKPMEATRPLDPLEFISRLLPLAERWLKAQVDNIEAKERANDERMLTPEEAGIRMHLNVQTVMTWCREGKLEAYKIGGNKTNGRGGKWLIPREAVDAHLKGRHLIHGDKRGPAK